MNSIVSKMKASNELPSSIMNHESLCMGGTHGQSAKVMFQSFGSPYWSDITSVVVGVPGDAPHVKTALEGREGIMVIVWTIHNDYFGTLETEYQKFKVGGKPPKKSKKQAVSQLDDFDDL